LSFPDAGIEPAVGTFEQIDRRLGGIAGEDAVSLRAIALRLRKRILETDNFGPRRWIDHFGFHHRSLLSREGDVSGPASKITNFESRAAFN
jgi:hypothetical protein